MECAHRKQAAETRVIPRWCVLLFSSISALVVFSVIYALYFDADLFVHFPACIFI